MAQNHGTRPKSRYPIGARVRARGEGASGRAGHGTRNEKKGGKGAGGEAKVEVHLF